MALPGTGLAAAVAGVSSANTTARPLVVRQTWRSQSRISDDLHLKMPVYMTTIVHQSEEQLPYGASNAPMQEPGTRIVNGEPDCNVITSITGVDDVPNGL